MLGWNARDNYKRELMFGWNLARACGLYVSISFIIMFMFDRGCASSAATACLAGTEARACEPIVCPEALRKLV